MQRSFYSVVGAGVFLIACCYGFARFGYGLFSPALTEEFSLTPGTLGAIGAGSYVGYCVITVASMAVTGRLGPRRTAVLAGTMATIGMSAVAMAPSAVLLAVGVVVAGSSTGLASPPLAAAVTRWIRDDVRDRAQTIVNAGTGVGVILSVPIALLLSGDWRLAWATMAVIAAAATVLAGCAIPAGSEGPGVLIPRRPWRPGTPGLLVGSLLAGVGSVAVWNFGRDVTSGLGATTSAIVWAVVGAAGVIGACSGDLARRVGLTGAWRTAVAAMTAATLVYAIRPDTAVAVVPAAAAFGAAYIAITGVALLWATRVYPDAVAFGVGASFLAVAVGQALGAPAVGALLETTSVPTAFALTAATGACALLVRPGRVTSVAQAAASTRPRRR